MFWAAQYITRLPVKFTPKGVFLSLSVLVGMLAGHVVQCAHLGSVHDCAQAGGNAAAQQAHRLKRSLLVDLGHTHFMTYCVL